MILCCGRRRPYLVPEAHSNPMATISVPGGELSQSMLCRICKRLVLLEERKPTSYIMEGRRSNTPTLLLHPRSRPEHSTGSTASEQTAASRRIRTKCSGKHILTPALPLTTQSLLAIAGDSTVTALGLGRGSASVDIEAAVVGTLHGAVSITLAVRIAEFSCKSRTGWN